MLIDTEFPSQLSTTVTGMKECKFLLMMDKMLEKGWSVVGRVGTGSGTGEYWRDFLNMPAPCLPVLCSHKAWDIPSRS